VRFVVEELRAFEIYGVGQCDALNNFRRVEKPIAVVFPILDVVSKIVIDAIAHGVDVNDGRQVQSFWLPATPFCEIADGDHVGSVYRGAEINCVLKIHLRYLRANRSTFAVCVRFK
jgi:hypothetical protein